MYSKMSGVYHSWLERALLLYTHNCTGPPWVRIPIMGKLRTVSPYKTLHVWSDAWPVQCTMGHTWRFLDGNFSHYFVNYGEDAFRPVPVLFSSRAWKCDVRFGNYVLSDVRGHCINWVSGWLRLGCCGCPRAFEYMYYEAIAPPWANSRGCSRSHRLMS